MDYDPDKHHRRSARLKATDYAELGAYFVTVCTRERASLFGHVVNGGMHLNDAGEIAQRCWEDIPRHFPHVSLDAFLIMPNHIHGVIVIPGRGTACRAPTVEQFAKPTVGSIPTIVRSYKATVTRLVRRAGQGDSNPDGTDKGVIRLRRTPPTGFGWQRGFYEHVVRNERELSAIREYILANPARWDDDENNPAAAKP